MVESGLLPNLLYLVLMAGLWFLVLAVLNPGTGVFELLSLLALAAVGLATIWYPLNLWALLIIGFGIGLFVLSVYRWRHGIFLVASALSLALGSAFLFDAPGPGPGVSLPLAIVTTAVTVGFFWLVVRTTLDQVGVASSLDPAKVVGKVGEARTAIDLTGSAYVGGELWTVKASAPIQSGTPVRVVDKEGLMLIVEPEEGKD